MSLRVEAMLIVVAAVITLAHLWIDSPYAMGAFVFIAQPLYLIAGIYYLRHVVGDLIRREARKSEGRTGSRAP